MADSEKWRGAHIGRYDDGHPEVSRVVFIPRFLQGARGAGEEPKKVPRPAEVVVRTGSHPGVAEYAPSEVALQDITGEDCEREAIEEVRVARPEPD